MAGVPHPFRSIAVTTAPAEQAVELGEVMAHLRLPDGDMDQGYVRSLITAATQYVEARLGRALITQTVRSTFDLWPSSRYFILPRCPLQSITSVQYVDTDGATATLSSSLYAARTEDEPGAILLDDSELWPSHQAEEGAIRVTYVVGYGAAPSDVPQLIRQHIAVLVAGMYEHREPIVSGTIVSKIPGAVSMSDAYRVHWPT